VKKIAITAVAVLGAVVIVFLAFDMALRLTTDSQGDGSMSEEAAAATGLAVPTASGQDGMTLPPGEQDAAGLRTMDVTLFFSRPDALGLAAEIRPIYETRDMLDRLKQTVAALIAGPAMNSPLLPVLPPSTTLRGLFLDTRGTLYLDLGQGLVRNLAPGTSNEILAVGGLANTLSANFPQVKRVQILVEGEEVRTLTGHLDLTYPVPPDPSLIVPPEAVPFPDPGTPSGEDPQVTEGNQPAIW
jgi:spore germination protein GerM